DSQPRPLIRVHTDAATSHNYALSLHDALPICLGLYGLASFMAVQKTKEVGIRKVLGATAGGIVYLFSKEFVLLVAIAFAIAAPITWYSMHQWLQGYAYRIDVSWWLFVAGGLAAIVVALATISFQTIKAARANPVKSLRTE